ASHREATGGAALRRTNRGARCENRHHGAGGHRARESRTRHTHGHHHAQRRPRRDGRPGDPSVRREALGHRSQLKPSLRPVARMVIHPLDLKLLRDVGHMKGQMLAVALIMACGLAMMIMTRSLILSLESTRAAYYERYRFADVFSDLKRAPN